MATKADLQEHARSIAQSHNHNLTGWIAVGHLARSECRHCGKTVHVNTKTQAVTGPAMTEDCPNPDWHTA